MISNRHSWVSAKRLHPRPPNPESTTNVEAGHFVAVKQMAAPLPGLLRLVAWIIPMAAFWLLALPWMASHPSVAAYIEWLDDCGVDPSAMYYTDLEAMKPIRERLNVGAGLTSATPVLRNGVSDPRRKQAP